MNEPRIKVAAKALYESDSIRWSVETPWEDCHQQTRENYFQIAAVAIGAADQVDPLRHTF